MIENSFEGYIGLFIFYIFLINYVKFIFLNDIFL